MGRLSSPFSFCFGEVFFGISISLITYVLPVTSDPKIRDSLFRPSAIYQRFTETKMISVKLLGTKTGGFYNGKEILTF